MNKKLIVICGPTASGKTALSIFLAKKFNGAIISADSRQIYKEMDVGTTKLPKAQMSKLKCQNGIIHYMVDLVKPDQEFSLADYQKQVFKIWNNIYQKNRSLTTNHQPPVTPLLVGGTGLYIRSIIDGFVMPKVVPDKKLRMKLEKENIEDLFEKLKKIDPDTASVIDKNNQRRLIRALEVCLSTKKPFSEQRKSKNIDFDVLQIGINIPRQELYHQIDKRVDAMIEEGLIDETKKLLKKYDKNLPSMSGIGYKEITRYLNKEITLKKACELIKYRTHAYARRQLTWFRKDKRIKWVTNQQEAEKLIQKFL
jgi:tRNA dimethylallyltransferase